MKPVAILESACAASLFDADGEPIQIELLPPLSVAEIEAFATSLPCPLPEDVRTWHRRFGGVSGLAADPLSFTGGLPLAGDNFFPSGLPIGGDGFGNFWVVDLLPESRSFGTVYFVCHDPPVLLLQAESLAQFLHELVRLATPPNDSLVDAAHEDRLFEVWRKNPGTLKSADGIGAGDPVLREFATGLDTGWAIVDLRSAEPGFGFSWGRYGHRTEIRRHGDLPAFAYRRPPCRPRRQRVGWWTRRFGGGTVN